MAQAPLPPARFKRGYVEEGGRRGGGGGRVSVGRWSGRGGGGNDLQACPRRRADDDVGFYEFGITDNPSAQRTSTSSARMYVRPGPGMDQSDGARCAAAQIRHRASSPWELTAFRTSHF